MRPIPVVLMVALVVTGCAAQAARDPEPIPRAPAAAASSVPSSANLAGLDGSEWRFVELDGQPVPAGVNATLRLHGGRAAGKAGCNAYGARYQIAADGGAKFEQTLSTRMACLQPAGVMHVEQGVFNAFRNTAKVAIVNGDLVMLDAAGKPLAKLAPTASPE
jgi:heat shock protein HslJ